MLIDRDHISTQREDDKLLTRLPQTADYKSGFDPSSFQRASLALKVDS